MPSILQRIASFAGGLARSNGFGFGYAGQGLYGGAWAGPSLAGPTVTTGSALGIAAFLGNEFARAKGVDLFKAAGVAAIIARPPSRQQRLTAFPRRETLEEICVFPFACEDGCFS